MDLAISWRLGPLDGEDEMIVAEAVEGGDRFRGVLLLVVVHEGESLNTAIWLIGWN